jgi:hypothetical protein
MTQSAILWPMLAHVLLVFIAYVVLGIRRYQAVALGEARAGDYKLRGNEPERSATATANVMNQFEAPVLLHVACLSLFVTQGVDAVALTLAWLFVASRYLHASIHLTSNKLRYRSYSFRTGLALLALLWVWLAVHLATGA